MNTTPSIAIRLVDEFVAHRPLDAATYLERTRPESVALILDQHPQWVPALLEAFRPDFGADVLRHLGADAMPNAMRAVNPAKAASLLARLDEDDRTSRLNLLDPSLAGELTEFMEYRPDSAGGIMDPQFTTFRPDASVGQALRHLRTLGHKRIHFVFLMDEEHRFLGGVSLQDLATTEPTQNLKSLLTPLPHVLATASITEVAEVLEQTGVSVLPVTDIDGRIVGVIRQAALLRAAEADASADIQSMVGASKEERALSRPAFAIGKRLPWLNINLITAFMAASVVALFEDTIAQFTALAVLLPVVAGQSGNTGAQALAVTMRGLALREIRVRQWFRIGLKETVVGGVNGVAVGLVTGLGVWMWSGSMGLAGVMVVAMALSMTIASLSGASVPMILTLLKQDPAQSSSIILTTVTDIVGFLSFLGLATLASGML